VGFVTVSRIENGHVSPTVAMLEKLAAALDITVREFFPVGWPRQERPRKPNFSRSRKEAS
jgi:transcriptional regulator with XRE-family HTH domain